MVLCVSQRVYDDDDSSTDKAAAATPAPAGGAASGAAASEQAILAKFHDALAAGVVGLDYFSLAAADSTAGKDDDDDDEGGPAPLTKTLVVQLAKYVRAPFSSVGHCPQP